MRIYPIDIVIKSAKYIEEKNIFVIEFTYVPLWAFFLYHRQVVCVPGFKWNFTSTLKAMCNITVCRNSYFLESKFCGIGVIKNVAQTV